MMTRHAHDLFDLTGRVAIITGGAGLLGQKHGEIIAKAGGIPVLVDRRPLRSALSSDEWSERFGEQASESAADITVPAEVETVLREVLSRYGRVDILINNAANNPKVEEPGGLEKSRLEHFPLEQWQHDLAVARRKSGVIVNIASDLALIAPDQRLYHRQGLPEDRQPVKPVSYSVVKTGLLGLTRYLATYWAADGVRANAISPGGVYNSQPDEFLQRISNLIPLGRMAHVTEYQGALLFLCSEASSYMTGANLVIDGGRSCW